MICQFSRIFSAVLADGWRSICLYRKGTILLVIMCLRTKYGRGSAGILKQFMGAKEPSRNRVVVPARKAPHTDGIGSLESILGLHKSLKIRAQVSV
jgi:hypothetical protein